MIMIKHAPIFDTARVADLFSKRDGVPVKYVCTSELTVSDIPMDVFYRETPHPEFGNRYFGLFNDPMTGVVKITGADVIEDLNFGMIQDNEGNYWYSQTHHNCLFIDESMIDGGRQYIRSSGPLYYFKVQDGELLEIKTD